MFILSFGVVKLISPWHFWGVFVFNPEKFGDDFFVDTWTAITSRGVPLKRRGS